jgi:DNA-binding CsgD family transcriptional regulator
LTTPIAGAYGEALSGLRPTKRRLSHLAAAAALPDEAAWPHLVAAASGADEALAAALEAAAENDSAAVPGWPGADRLLEWASDLSEDAEGRERRLLKAGIARVCSEMPGSACLWDRIADCAPSALRDCALAGHAVLEGRELDAEFLLNRAAATAGEQGLVKALAHGLRASLNLTFALGLPAADEAAAGLALACQSRGVDRWLLRLHAAGKCYAEGPRVALSTLGKDQGTRLARPGGEPADQATRLAVGCYQVLAGEPGEAVRNLSELASPREGQVQSAVRFQASLWLALACHLLGSWREAGERARSASEIADQGLAHALLAIFAAHLADWAAADEHLTHASQCAAGEGADGAVLTDVARLAVAHANGTLTASHPALTRLADAGRAGDAPRKFRALWLPLRAEALIGSGSARDARAALAELAELAEQVPYLKVARNRMAGLFAERRRDRETALRHYAAELPAPSLVVPLQLGLTEHRHGRLLCELGDLATGRDLIERAHARLLACGATAYARRCAADLADVKAGQEHASTGDLPTRRSALLTERQRSVARLIAAGLSNQEAAARLYISVKTVEYHLSQIYGKLGIKSRRQLAGYRPLP